MKIENLKPGMTVWDVGTYGVGNTTMRSVGVWSVHVVAVHPDRRVVEASWNGNPPQTFREKQWKRWRAKRPLLIELGFNCYRLATREEAKNAATQTTT